jgi:rare lipoprotein A
MRRIRASVLLASFLLTAGCTLIGGPATVAPLPPPDVGSTADPVPYAQPASALGNMAQYEQSGRTYRVLDSSYGYDERGLASWYGEEFNGRQTSSGERFDMYALSGAHRTLPIPTYVRVTNLSNGRSVVVRVNDRGPFRDPETRIIDVSYAAALRLDMVRDGTASVRVQALEPWQYRVR